jgi:hypothetical protein
MSSYRKFWQDMMPFFLGDLQFQIGIPFPIELPQLQIILIMKNQRKKRSLNSFSEGMFMSSSLGLGLYLVKIIGMYHLSMQIFSSEKKLIVANQANIQSTFARS